MTKDGIVKMVYIIYFWAILCLYGFSVGLACLLVNFVAAPLISIKAYVLLVLALTVREYYLDYRNGRIDMQIHKQLKKHGF